jgi:RNA polymerase sigma-70 factor (ECF subfamily)
MAADPLVRFLETRDRDAFAALVRRTHKPVFRAAWRVLGDRAAAEDVAQDVYLRCLNPPWEAAAVRDGTALLVATAVNLAKMSIRGDVRRRGRERTAVDQAAGRQLPDADTLAHVRHAVAGLPDALRDVVELRYFGGLRLEDLARALDVSLTTAKQRLREARDLLRPRLADAQYGAFLAFVGGEALELGWTDPSPSAAFESALRRLADDGVSLSRIAARRPRRMNWLTAAGLVVAAGAVLFAVATGIGDDDGPGDTPGAAETAEADEADGGASRGRRERERVDSGGGSGGTLSIAADAGGADAAGSGAPAAVDASEDEDAGSIDLEVLVLDARGEPVRRGELELDLAGFPGFDVMERLARYRDLLDPFPLSEANPVVIEDLADFTDGIEIEAAARVPGHPPSASRTVLLGKGERARITLRVLPASQARIVVVDAESGEPVQDAEILFLTELERRELDQNTPPPAPSPGVGRTDGSGRTTVGGLGEGPHRIEVRAEGYRVATRDDVPTERETVVQLRRLIETGTVIANVRGPDGHPKKGQRVELSVSGRDTALIAETGPDGTCRFDDVPPGHHMVMLDIIQWAESLVDAGVDPGDAALTEGIELVAGAEHEVRLGFLPKAAPLVVEVRGPDGQPREGVKVHVFGSLLREGETAADGRITFDALPAGEYSVHVDTGTDWTVGRDVVIDAGSPGHVRAVVGSGTIAGRVVGPDGKPQRRCGVFVDGPLGALEWTDADGRFSLAGAPPGSYAFTISAGGDLLVQSQEVVVVEGETTEPLDIRLRPGGRIRILRAAGDRCVVRAVDAVSDEREALEDDDGHLELRALPPGPCVVEILREGVVVATHRVEVRAGDVAQIDLR